MGLLRGLMYKRVIWWALVAGAAWMGYRLGQEMERQRQVTWVERVKRLVYGAGEAINE